MKSRLVTAAILILVALSCALAAHPLPLRMLLALIAGIGVFEFAKVANRRVVAPISAGVLLIGYWYLLTDLPNLVKAAQLVALMIAGALWAPWFIRKGTSLFFEGGSLWIAAPLASVGLVHDLDPVPTSSLFNLHSIILMVALPLWAGDTCGYLVGKTWGRHLLAPRISPKKTVEGSLAYFAGSLLVGLMLSPWVGIPASWGAALGTSAGLLGQIGDLYQSGLKRSAGVKDSGVILPGHGGVLDRIDSLLFAAPVQILLLAWLVSRP